ncbi:MAG TPA: SAV2148 family HEPN domain-containing protein [Candidatus Bathyarchaeia archaeon]|nr:SAV2148 family HEPN domain-containing protein [Candidatus Bathyarchaeia archaeon]
MIAGGKTDERVLALGLIAQFFGTRMGLRNHVEFMATMGMSNLVGSYKAASIRNGLDSTYPDPGSFSSFVQALLFNHKLGTQEVAELELYLNILGYTIKEGKVIARVGTFRLAETATQSIYLPQAQKMARAYAVLHVLENELRHFVIAKLKEAWGNEFESKIPAEISEKWQKRIEGERLSPWHETEIGEPIAYSNFKELREVINKNWLLFEPYFKDRAGAVSRLDELEIPRNTIAHNRQLKDSEVDRLILFSGDILRCIRSE